MQLDRQPQPPRGVKHARDLRRRERDALAEAIDGVDHPLGGQRRHHDVRHERQIAFAVGLVFGWQGVGAQEGRAHGDGSQAGQATRDAKAFALRLEIEPIAGLDLDRADALGEQRIEPGKALVDQILVAGRSRRADGRDDAAARASDLFIAGAFQPHLEFARATAAVDEMGVAIDESRQNPAPLAIHRFGARKGGQLTFGAGKEDAPLGGGDRAALDDAEPGPRRRQRGEPGVAPDLRLSGGRGHQRLFPLDRV